MKTLNEYLYDGKCKKILCDKQLLALILKLSMKEYASISIAEIANLIEPSVGRKENTSRIFPRENEIVDEDGSRISFDILFSAKFPNSNTSIDTIINLEMQNNIHPRGKNNKPYSLLKRGIFYIGKMIVRQKGVTFTSDNYQNLKKVNSIWICSRPPKEKQNSIQRYSLQEEQVVGKLVHENMYDYDMINMCIINLGKDSSVKELEPLNELFVRKHTEQEIYTILQDQYGIALSAELRGDVEDMCNFSKGIYNDGLEDGIELGNKQGFEKGIEQGFEKGIEQGIEKGIEQGIEKGKITAVKDLMDSLLIDIEKAMTLLKLDEDLKAVCREAIIN